MAYAERHTVTLTTDASGDAEGFTPVLTGQVVNVIYTKSNYADTVDFAITAESTGIGIWTESNVTASKTVAPTQPANTQVGGALATAGDVQRGPIYVAAERVRIVVDEGGNTTSGTFTVVVA